MLPCVTALRPRVVADLAGAGDRVEAPQLLACLRVERGDAAADLILATRNACVDATVVVQRRGRDRVAVLPARDPGRPHDLARLLVERDELAVELPDVQPPVAERDAATNPATAERRYALVEVRPVLPEDLARRDVDGERVVDARRDVDHPLVLERLPF